MNNSSTHNCLSSKNHIFVYCDVAKITNFPNNPQPLQFIKVARHPLCSASSNSLAIFQCPLAVTWHQHFYKNSSIIIEEKTKKASHHLHNKAKHTQHINIPTIKYIIHTHIYTHHKAITSHIYIFVNISKKYILHMYIIAYIHKHLHTYTKKIHTSYIIHTYLHTYILHKLPNNHHHIKAITSNIYIYLNISKITCHKKS